MVITHNVLFCRQRVDTDSRDNNLEDIYSYAIPGNDTKQHS